MSYLNDPRVLFAAERTLLAWNRTSLALMAFGFVIERFGLFMQMFAPQQNESLPRGLSFWIGIAFILLGAGAAIVSIVEFRRVLRALSPPEIPEGYRVNLGVYTTGTVAALGIALSVYLIIGLLH
jgi:putative membrane protein